MRNNELGGACMIVITMANTNTISEHNFENNCIQKPFDAREST